MKIIFLDIDGVLNSRDYDKRRDRDKLTNIDETRLPLVKRIADGSGAKIVLSSTWREDWDRDPARCGRDGVYINETFAKFGLNIFDKTPDLGIRASRKEEIAAWLEKAKDVTAFVIIDDYAFGFEELTEKLVKTNPVFGLGLEDGHVAKALKILNG